MDNAECSRIRSTIVMLQILCLCFFNEKYGFILISNIIYTPEHSLTKCRIRTNNVNCEIVSTLWKEYFLPFTVLFLSCLLQELSHQFELGHKRYGWIDHN
jgi:hypothetical protein